MSNIRPLTLKRIAGDLRKFKKAKPEHFEIIYDNEKPLEINFLLIGRKDTPFDGGHYLGKIVHSPEYPAKAPDYYIFTPSGRFEINRKICLTNSGYHQRDWAPAAWNLLTLLEGLSSVWHSEIGSDKIGIGHIQNISEKDLKKFALESKEYNRTKLSDLYKKFSKSES